MRLRSVPLFSGPGRVIVDPCFGVELRRHYLARGIDKVYGWLTTADKFLIQAVCEIQTESQFGGSVGEIGVHHGKLFILLYLNLHEGEKAFCIDVFEQQHLNVDKSGKGDESIFLDNVARYADKDLVHVIKESSLNVRAADIVDAVGKARLISIDGGHTRDITANDLALCDTSLCDHGVIIVDDYFNPSWPGVSEGVVSYVGATGRDLTPFAIGRNKVFFCRRDFHSHYRAKLNERCHEMHSKAAEFLGAEVDVFNGYASLSDLFSHMRFWRARWVARRTAAMYATRLGRVSTYLRLRKPRGSDQSIPP